MELKLLIRFLAFCFLLFVSGYAHAERQLNEGAVISLLTCSPGTELYSVFGHSAIRVQDPIAGVDSVYNYGTFDFNTEGFYLKFAQGKLDYMLSRQFFPYFQYEYLLENRSIEEQVLDLDVDEKQLLYRLLEENYRPENRFYRYDFFFDNCATRIRDLLQNAFGEELKYHMDGPKGVTFRQQVEEYTAAMPWSTFGISLALGTPYNREINGEEIMFLPDDLMEGFAKATLNGKPLCFRPVELLNAEQFESAGELWTPNFVGLIILSLIVLQLFLERRKSRRFELVRKFEMLVFGLVGMLVLLLWVATDHVATKPNWDVLWLMPFHLFLWPWSGSKHKWVQFYFGFCLLILLYSMIRIGSGWFPLYYLYYMAGVLLWTASQYRPFHLAVRE